MKGKAYSKGMVHGLKKRTHSVWYLLTGYTAWIDFLAATVGQGAVLPSSLPGFESRADIRPFTTRSNHSRASESTLIQFTGTKRTPNFVLITWAFSWRIG